MESTNGKEHKRTETSLLFPNGTHEGFGKAYLLMLYMRGQGHCGSGRNI